MRKLLIILFVVGPIFAQSENQSQSIELPDFVITGKQKIDLPVIKKSKADPVSLLSKDFFFPTFSPEQFSMATVAKPKQLIADLIVPSKNYSGQLILGAGQYTLPTGEFYLSKGFEVGKIYSKLWGLNRKDFVDYADYNLSGINIGSEFYLDRNTSFLPGAIITIDGKFIRKEYNFYSTYFPTNLNQRGRETQNFIGGINLKNYYSDYVDYNLNFETDYLDIKDASAKEMNLSFSGDAKLNFGEVSFLLSGSYRLQSISKSSTDENYSFINPYGGIEYNPAKNMIIKAGIQYYSYDVKRSFGTILGKKIVKEDFIVPSGEIKFLFDNNLSLSATYNPGVEFKSYSDLLKVNPYTYFNNGSPFDIGFDNNTTKYNHRINASVKYGYKKYYELSFGTEYFTADDYAYFNPDLSPNNTRVPLPVYSYRFQLDRISNVTEFSIYANALYHLGPFGWFYGDAKYQIIESDDNWTQKTVTLPYNPKISLEAVYGYKFNFGFSIELKLHYLKDTYADIQNSILLDDYINLSTMLRYSLTQNFDFTLHLNNLLNRDIQLWLGYDEVPFDFTAGIDFRF